MGPLPSSDVFRKENFGAPSSFFEAEAAGLRWLNVEGGTRVVEVTSVEPNAIELRRLETCPPISAAARDFAGSLATIHRTQCEAFGEAPPGAPSHGFIGNAGMRYGSFADFHRMYVEIRVIPYVRDAYDAGTLSASEAAELEALALAIADNQIDAGSRMTPRRIHGDLWSGNLMWVPTLDGAGVEVCLIDPSAHGGHPETDLAMLQLFGMPYWDHFIEVYEEQLPLHEDWRERVEIHQLYPLLVHVVLFGRGYADQLLGNVRRIQSRN